MDHFDEAPITAKRSENLIPCSEPQEETVIDWVKDAVGGDEKVTEIETALQSQLDEQYAPSKAAGVPWGN